MTVRVKYNEPLSKYTTFRIGGVVREMYFPESTGQAAHVHAMLHERGITPLIIGNGSNILADDKDLDIVAVNTAGMKRITLTDTVISAESGVLLSELAAYACGNSLSGLEFARGIPGTLGGAVIMNAGAYGSEIKDVVYATNAYSTDKGIYTVVSGAHGFDYRNSVFSKGGSIILSCVVHLREDDRDAIEQRMNELMMRRRESQPLEQASAGSTFKRPENGYAAQLIERAGLKGYSVGAAQVSPKHAGFIVNNGGATFDDVIRLIEYVQDTVEKRTGVRLEPEVKIIRE